MPPFPEETNEPNADAEDSNFLQASSPPTQDPTGERETGTPHGTAERQHRDTQSDETIVIALPDGAPNLNLYAAQALLRMLRKAQSARANHDNDTEERAQDGGQLRAEPSTPSHPQGPPA